MMRLLKCEKVGHYYRISVEERKWFGLGKPTTIQFVGEGTVYHYVPSGKRASTHIEYWLSDVTFIHKYNSDMEISL